MTNKEAIQAEVKRAIQEDKKWTQMQTMGVIKAAWLNETGSEMDKETEAAIWEPLNASAFRQKMEKKNLIPKADTREKKVGGLLDSLGV